LLRQRQEEEERIEADRRKRVIVTIDLLGRKVLQGCYEDSFYDPVAWTFYTFVVNFNAGFRIFESSVEEVTHS